MNRRILEFGCGIVVVGILAGFAGMATSVLLDAVEHLTYHYSFGSLLGGVTDSSPLRRALGPMVGGALAGFGWWMLRRRTAVPTLDKVIAGGGKVPRLTLSLDAALQVLLVGSGASLGREGAPRQFAAALGDLGTSRWALTSEDRRILLGCAAGAGLAAVYAVPIGGALFAIQILLRSWHPRVVGTALITSSLAVAVASPVTHERHPLQWPDPGWTLGLSALALALAPVAFAVGLLFNRVTDAARPAVTATSWLLIPGIAGAGLLIGICSLWAPELPGNGESILTVSLASDLTLASALALVVLKPLLTAVYLRAGAVGGMLTPSLATGAAMGSAVALALNTWTPLAVSIPVMSLTCAAGVLAITQRAPIWAAVFVWELARPPWWVLAPFLLAALGAHWLRLARDRRLAAGRRTPV